MTVLRDSGCNKPKKIIKSFEPFKNPRNIEGMIIGNDLDSLLSSSFLKNLFNWDIVGIYDYKTLWYDIDNKHFIEKINNKKYLAVDLDIYNNNIPSIGHHILAFNEKDKISEHSNSLNPNLMRGINRDQFRRKYPLSTILFLVWVFGFTHDLSNLSRKLIWLADSSYINGQKHRFKFNVLEWLNNFFKDDI
jgi:hypothetical protein